MSGTRQVNDNPAAITQVTNRGDSGSELIEHRPSDDIVEVVSAHVGEPTEGIVGAVRAQMDVGVDQTGQQCRARQVGHLAPVRRCGGARLDAENRGALDENEGAAGQHPLAVERSVCSVSAHACPSDAHL
jgi:hypothetical protein